MKEFVEKLIGRLEELKETYRKIRKNTHCRRTEMDDCDSCRADHYLDARLNCVDNLISIVNQLAEEYNNGWIPVSDRLPECENKYGWVSCIVSVIRSHYPTSTYDICDAPYDENIVMHADYNVSQKIWHLECDEQLNALMDIEDAPLNCDYVIAWMPLPAPFQKGE